MHSVIKRKLRVLAISGALIGATGCMLEADTSDSADAESAVVPGSPVAAIGFVINFYKNVFNVANLMRSKPADPLTVATQEINARIDAARDQVLNALADGRWKDRKLEGSFVKAQITTVFTDYKELTSMSPTDREFAQTRRETQDKATDLLNYFVEIVSSGLEPQLSYDLAQAYNALVVTYIGILKIKGEVTPSDPAPTFLYADALSRAMQANYKLIGARKQGCSASQYIPRRDRMYVGKSLNLVAGDLVGPLESSAYRKSQLFQLFTTKWVVHQREFTCNISTNKCTAPPYYEGSKNGAEQSCTDPRLSTGMAAIFNACLQTAENVAAKAFNADPVVGFIRESQRAMMQLGAVTVSTAGGGFPGTNPAVGSYFDPVIPEPYVVFHACEAGRRTYVIDP